MASLLGLRAKGMLHLHDIESKVAGAQKAEWVIQELERTFTNFDAQEYILQILLMPAPSEPWFAKLGGSELV